MRRTVYGVAASTRPCSLTLAEYREGELADGRASVRTFEQWRFRRSILDVVASHLGLGELVLRV